MIPVRLFHADRHVVVEALIDSGADITLFHSSLAEVLGIPVESGRHTVAQGISGDPVDVYFQRIKFQVVV